MPKSGIAPIRRAEVIRAVLHLLATEGWEAVTIRRVTEVSGISAGAITHFLGTKQEMVAAAVSQGYRDYELRMSRVLETDMAPPEKLTSWIADTISPTTEREWSFWIGLWGRAPFDPGIREVLRDVYRAHSRQLARLIAEGIRSGHFAPVDADVAADQLVAAIDGLALRVIVDPDCTFRYVRKVVDNLVHSCLPAPSTAVTATAGQP